MVSVKSSCAHCRINCVNGAYWDLCVASAALLGFTVFTGFVVDYCHGLFCSLQAITRKLYIILVIISNLKDLVICQQ